MKDTSIFAAIVLPCLAVFFFCLSKGLPFTAFGAIILMTMLLCVFFSPIKK